MSGQTITLDRDPVKAALEAMKRLDEQVRSKCANESGSVKADGLVRRLKEFPQLMLQAGLTPALTFYLSKLDHDKKRKAYKATLNALFGGSTDDLCKNLSGEGGGYPQALALLLAYASLHAGCNLDSIREVNANLVECIRRIEQKGIILEGLMEAYATELKKLATALYGE